MTGNLSELLKEPYAMMKYAAGSQALSGYYGTLELNVSGYPFPGWSSPAERQAVLELIMPILIKMRRRNWAFIAEIPELSAGEQKLLMEHGHITGSMVSRRKGGFVLLNDRQDTECCVNDDEHLYFRSFYPGREGLENACHELKLMMADFKKKLNVAHDDTLGYLYSEPLKAGAGIVFSALLHLPAVRFARAMDQMDGALGDMGVFLSPMFPSDTKYDDGNIYHLHSPSVREGELEYAMEMVQTGAQSLAGLEKVSMDRLMNTPKSAEQLRRAVRKSYARLTTGKRIKYSDLRAALSMLRLGLATGILSSSIPEEERTRLLGFAYHENTPAHMKFALSITESRARREQRAQYAKNLILNKLNVSAPD